MGNIIVPTLPDRAGFAPDGAVPYGPALRVRRNGGGPTLNLESYALGVAVYASSEAIGKASVVLTRLDNRTVQYVNKFLADPQVAAPFTVIRDWRKARDGDPHPYVVKTIAAGSTTPTSRPPYARKPAAGVVLSPSATTALSGALGRAVAAAAAIPEVEVAPDIAVLEAALEGVGVEAERERVDAAIEALDGPAPVEVDRKTGLPKGVKSKGNRVILPGNISIPKRAWNVLTTSWALRQPGIDLPAAVLVTGPAGTAKTLSVRAFGKALGIPVIKADGGMIRTADDWVGTMDPKDGGGWGWRWSHVAEALRKAEPCIILIDELNRPETPAALNALLGLLDETGTLDAPGSGERLLLPPGVMVVATINEGVEYVGTLPIDGAVRQRFGRGIHLDYPTPAVEAGILRAIVPGLADATSSQMAALAGDQRRNREDPAQYPTGAGISTRMLVDAARSIVHVKVDPRTALEDVFTAQFPADKTTEAALKTLLDGHIGKPVTLDDDEA